MALSIGELVGYVSLEGAQEAVESVGDTLGDGGSKWSKVLMGAGAVAGGAFIASLGMAMGDEVSTDKLSASLGLTADESKRMGKVAGDLYSQAYGDSLADTSEAIASVVKNIDGMRGASEADLGAITAKVLDVSNAFDQDLGATTAAVGQMIRTGMAKDATEALDIITKGLQGPANKADDLLETFNEYGTQFRKVGLDGKTATGLLSQGLQAGARDADVVADSIKEFSIRSLEALTTVGSDGTKQLTPMGQALQDIGVDGESMQRKLAKGGPAAKRALDSVLDGLRGVEDPTKRAQLAVQLFGTQAEDMGDALYALDPSKATAALGKVGGAADRMGKTLNDNASTNITMMSRQLRMAFVSVLGGQVIPAVTKATGVMAGALGPALSTVTGFLNDNHGAILLLAGILAAVLVPRLIVWGVQSTIAGAKAAAAWAVSQAAATRSAAVQVWGALVSGAGWIKMGVQATLGAARVAAAWLIAMGPIGIAIALVVGMVALIIAKWDTIKKVTAAAWAWVVKTVTGALQGAANFLLRWSLPGIIATHWGTIKRITSTAISAVVTFIRGLPARAAGALSAFGGRVSGVLRSGMTAGLGVVRNIGGTILGWISAIPGKIGALGGRMGKAGRDLLQDFINGMKNAAGIISGIAGKVWDAVRRLLNGAISKINRALEFRIDKGPVHISINPPDIPMLATGGRADGATLAVIGEGREPETVLPDSLLRGLLERVHAAGRDQGMALAGAGYDGPLIGYVNQYEGESAQNLAERLAFIIKKRG